MSEESTGQETHLIDSIREIKLYTHAHTVRGQITELQLELLSTFCSRVKIGHLKLVRLLSKTVCKNRIVINIFNAEQTQTVQFHVNRFYRSRIRTSWMSGIPLDSKGDKLDTRLTMILWSWS